MRIELIDRIMFPVMSKVCIKELQKDHPEWNGRAIKQNARRRFIKMLKETPSIGRLSQNHWKFIWLAELSGLPYMRPWKSYTVECPTIFTAGCAMRV